MRSCLWSTSLVLLLACQPAEGPPGSPDPQPQTTDSGTVLETGWPIGDLGNLHFARHVNTGRSEVFGMFIDGSAGFVNLAQCTRTDAVACIDAIPTSETAPATIVRDQEVDPDTVDTRFLGYEVEFGPYVLPYQEDRRTGFGLYVLDTTPLPPVEGPIGVTWNGQWGDRSTTDDLVVSPIVTLLKPGVASNTFVPNGTRLPIEWVPTGNGIVTLTVETRFTLYQLYRLDDDGFFELDVDTLGLTNALEELTLTLQRWDVSTIETEGHLATLLATSDVSFTADLANVGAREEIEPTDSCAEALGLAPLASGDYWGRLDGFGRDLDPDSQPNSCLATNPTAGAGGRDGLFKVELPPRSYINLEYTHLTESASVYFVDDCEDVQSCDAGIDADVAVGASEVLSLSNLSDDVETHYLVVDSTADLVSTPEVFTLDLAIEYLLDPTLYDRCDDAAAAASGLSTGGYYEEFVAYTADLNPGIGGCTGTSTPGAEAVVPVTIDPGQTLSASLEMEGGNGALYLLSSCAASSCVAGADLQGESGREALAYVNTGPAPVTLNLVIDSQVSGLRPFLLALSIQ